MTDGFWSLNSFSEKDILFVDNNDSYCLDQVNELIERFKVKVDGSSHVILKCDNTIHTLVAYLALLQLGIPMILVSADADAEVIARLDGIYLPSAVINGDVVKRCRSAVTCLDSAIGVLLSTSGSTGASKLVKISRRGLQANAQSICEYLELTKHDVAVTMLPFEYSYGLSVINSHLLSGSKIVLNDSSVLSKEFWEKVSEQRVTGLVGVPFTYQTIRRLKYERFKTDSVRYLTQAGGKLDADTIKYFLDATSAKGQNFFVMYGQTEATARMTYLDPLFASDKLGSIGKPIPGGRIEVLSSDGEKIEKPYVQGQLVYYGDNVMLGYANNFRDLQTGDCMHSRLETGDIGYFDDDGFLFITGREKRFIKINGSRISLDEVDMLISEYSDFGASFGNDDNLVLLFTSENQTDEAIIVSEINKRFKINENYISVRLISEMPRNSNGKINYSELNSMLSK